jgi:predicted RNase H-like HicB family nuclease
MIGVYSTTVGGQQYAGTIEQSNGEYTVSVPNIPGPGANASGTSEMAAENNLDTVIDELV